ncbi:MAG TPA: hypothetical protein VFG46_15880 [Chryseolinea sp.]|nr:hypothetical protein [Chryseolinea sp.]
MTLIAIEKEKLKKPLTKIFIYMKHIKLILASTMVIAAFAANAQDTTKLKVPPPPVQQDQTAPQNQAQKDQANFKKDMIVIPSAQVPASLRSTLQASQYKGWESGTIYRNQTSDMFMVEMRDGNQTKIYRFDQNGKAIKDF